MCNGSFSLTNSKSITNVIWSPGISEVTFPFLQMGESWAHKGQVMYPRPHCLGETYHLHISIFLLHTVVPTLTTTPHCHSKMEIRTCQTQNPPSNDVYPGIHCCHLKARLVETCFCVYFWEPCGALHFALKTAAPSLSFFLKFYNFAIKVQCWQS